MIKIINKLAVLLFLAFLTFSCSETESLERYYVDSESKSDILMLDIPTSLLVVNDNLSADAQQALNSVRKLNLLAFKLNKNNNANFLSEKAKVKEILNNDSYKELMRVTDRNMKFKVKYLGDDDSMNEVIVYALDNKKGFVLGRLLGNDMKPENMIKLLESVKNLDADNEAFKTFANFFDGQVKL